MKSNLEYFEQSKQVVPGGVHSPVRSFKGLPIPPRFIKWAKGATFEDVEGKSYIDFCMSFGPLILGHRHPEVETKLKEALERGWSYGACEPYSLELAQFLLSKLPFGEQIRFVNSGTEAVMTALRLARGFTQKDKILKFSGCYHGHTDSMLIQAGSGLAGSAEASSDGISKQVAGDTLIVELDDIQKVEDCFKAHLGQIAAVIIEPLPANNGLLEQRTQYLKELRQLTHKYQALLIFDEVISGFRVGFSGMVGKTGIKPDLVTYGKIIGGGLPVGAVVSSREVMKSLAPVGGVYQAGTLSANPLAMVCGLATVKLLDDDFYARLAQNTQIICQIFEQWLKREFGRPYFVHQFESLFWIHKGEGPITQCSLIPAGLGKDFEEFFVPLLDKGIYLAPNAYEVGFCSQAHNDELIEEMKKRLEI